MSGPDVDTRPCPPSELRAELRAAVRLLAETYGLGDVEAQAVGCVATRWERPPGWFGKLLSRGGSTRYGAVLMTPSHLVWSVTDGRTDATANGARLSELELRPSDQVPGGDAWGLHVHGQLLRGSEQRASAWITLGEGDATATFRRALEERVTAARAR